VYFDPEDPPTSGKVGYRLAKYITEVVRIQDVPSPVNTFRELFLRCCLQNTWTSA
jgi:hypothetical protein